MSGNCYITRVSCTAACRCNGSLRVADILRHRNIDTFPSPISAAYRIRPDGRLVDQQAATPDEHGPAAIATDIKEGILRERQLTPARQGAHLEVRLHLNGTGKHFSWRRHTRNLHPPTWGHELAADDLDLATHY
jgi:hypothetical protein